jgi:hypothetical protein
VTGSSASNILAEEADVVLAVGTRLQDFTTGSWSLFKNEDLKIIGLNVQPFDAGKHEALPLVSDARVGLEALDAALMGWQVDSDWTGKALSAKEEWLLAADAATGPTNVELPSDAQVIGAVQRARTKAIRRSPTPAWDEEFAFRVGDLGEELRISVVDEDKYFSDDFLGQVKVPLSAVLDADGRSLGTQWYRLMPKSSKSKTIRDYGAHLFLSSVSSYCSVSSSVVSC